MGSPLINGLMPKKGGGFLELPWSKNFVDYDLGDVPSSLLIGDENQPTPQVIEPYLKPWASPSLPLNNRLVRIPAVTNGVGDNTQSVGFPFPSPLTIPSSGTLTLFFNSIGGQTPRTGSGDNVQEGLFFGVYRSNGDDLVDKINKSSISWEWASSYYDRCKLIQRAEDTADYILETGSKATQIDSFATLRIDISLDGGITQVYKWLQGGTFKYYGEIDAAKTAAWLAADDGAPIEGFFIRNQYKDANNGYMEIGYIWIGMIDDAPSLSWVIPNSVG